MKLLKTNSIYIVFLMVFLAPNLSTSQNMLQGAVNKDIKRAARQTVEMWSGELALSAKQRKLMEDKIVEFSLKKNELLQSKMRQELKEQRIKELQVLENRDMRDILTMPQYEKYLEVLREQYGHRKPPKNRL